MNNYLKKISKGKEGLKKILLGFTIIDIVLLVVLGITLNRYFKFPIYFDTSSQYAYINKDNITNAFYYPDKFKENLFEMQLENTAIEIGKVIRGFSYFNTKSFKEIKSKVYQTPQYGIEDFTYENEFLNMIRRNYYEQVGFAYINKNTGEVISNEEKAISSLTGETNLNKINEILETNFPDSYIKVYDNKEEEGPFASNAILTDENPNYIEVYFKNSNYYNSSLDSFKNYVYKAVILLIVIIVLVVKGLIFFKRYGINGALKYNKDIFRSLIKGNLLNSIYLGFVGGIREKNYLAFLAAGTFANIIIVLLLSDYYYSLYEIALLGIIIEIILLLFYRDKIYYLKTLKELDNINEENLHYTIDEKSPYHFSNMIKEINLISKGYSKAVDERMKNDRLKTELISNVSHDLKTPLTSIINYIQIAQRSDITEEERKDFLDIVSNKSKRLKSLVDELFEAVRLSDEKMELDKQLIDIMELINQVLVEYSDVLKEKRLKLSLRCDQKDLRVQLDGNKMSRVIANLVNNICKYSKDGSEVDIRIKKDKRKLILEFSNYACYKMDFDEKEIFERFARGDKSRNSKIEGSGLGLAISKSIVQLHGGKMKVEKENDKFKVIIII